MTTKQVKVSEDRLDALRDEAARTGKVQAAGVTPAASPLRTPAQSVGYHNLPLLKAPTWTWQVPLYLFAGGVSGTSAVIALVAHTAGDAGLVRAALWIAFGGVLVSPPLLIADLGKPNRFLNMLRVFKLRSVMSVGAWTLSVFGSAIALALVCHELILAGYSYSPLLGLEWLAEIFAALTGLILASYTSVLLGVTAIPVWSENRRLIPAVFLAGGVGSASALLELLGFLVPATQFIGIVASSVETVIAIGIELRGRYVDKPLREGSVGWLVRCGGILAGPVALVFRTFWGHAPAVRYIAAFCFIAGALISRYAWIAAGHVSSRDPEAVFRIQRLHGKSSASSERVVVGRKASV
jgi:formate-dependent nitrite reductase membrane component NrfD